MAQSSVEAEIYVTDKCVKCLSQLCNIITDLALDTLILTKPINIYNDNAACVIWASKNLTTRGLRHIQMRENATREESQKHNITLSHSKGDINLSDIFTKEDKHAEHFITICNHLVCDPSL